MHPRLLPLAAGVLAVAAAAVSAQPPGPTDWPQWRGAKQDGKSADTGLLTSWPTGGPPKVWTVGGLGTGFGTPSVAAGKIYVMGAVDNKDGVFCLNEADGKQLWFTPIGPARMAQPNNGPGCQPTYHAGKIYAVTNAGTVAAIDAKTGKLDWTKSYEEFGARPQGWGFNDTVLADGDKLICAPGGSKGGGRVPERQDRRDRVGDPGQPGRRRVGVLDPGEDDGRHHPDLRRPARPAGRGWSASTPRPGRCSGSTPGRGPPAAPPRSRRR
jgi:hypothetical protein